MKRIVLHLVQSSLWLYGIFSCLGAIAFYFVPVRTEVELLRAFSMSNYGALICGPLVLAFRLQKGMHRPLLALPVDSSSAGHACWIAAVGVPYLWALSLSSIALLIKAGAGVLELPLANLPVVLLANFGYLGLVFFLLAQMPARPRPGFKAGARDAVVGGLWGASIGGGVFAIRAFESLPNWYWPHYLVLAVALGLTCAGWFESRVMLIRRAMPASDGASLPVSIPDSDRSSRTGWAVLFHASLLHSIKLIGFCFLAVIVLNAVLYRDFRGSNSGIIAPITFIALFGSLQWLTILRQLRSMPIANNTLVTALLATFLVPVLVAALCAAPFSAGHWDQYIESVAFLLGVAIIAPALALMTGKHIIVFLIAPVILMAGTLLTPKLSTIAVVSLGFVLAAIGTMAIRAAVLTSKRPYVANIFGQTA